MPKFTVVIWEQRRIEMEVEAENKDMADAHAVAVWDGINEDPTIDQAPEIKAIDEHDAKSIHVEEKAE
jgi:hypothetical protein